MLAGCATTPPFSFTNLIKLDNAGAAAQGIVVPAERRVLWFLNGKVCAEPPTDVGVNIQQLLSIAVDAKRGDIGAGASLESSLMSNLLELKGRTTHHAFSVADALPSAFYRQR